MVSVLESGAGAQPVAQSHSSPAAASGTWGRRLTTPAGYDPGRHKRGTNPCIPRRFKRASKRAEKVRRRQREWLANFGHALTNTSELTPEQRGNAWPKV